ncbi:MAG: hypothetical protein US40_C0004G0070 [Candidatus Roizmanbacteria bacterium GW2011_GWC2_37_13]|uniref:Polymerase nucleotidyl transferase domain-containing protein n=1 Tax=Candidatus Roizmanbacteria bacterium GW2011_GWC2_37_13 TaxID=1618486 RepID=A0A0G0GIU9_9BACT|nr:MAG: hypothetical protein US38_C0001G0057 [Candidatus Roizmanbacteria bacterium GW2011_GWC1_37_12]KKQ26035.1 MAG: hypothetical protein US40_C0004G0070 [Candidatus Roizmanbacteria bacterium GW2011_GWC2_37_13]
MDKKLASIIKYFAVFDYFPRFEEVYTFFPRKISKKTLKTMYEAVLDTPPQYSIIRNPKSAIKQLINYELRITNSKKKLRNWRFRLYIKLVLLFPQIKLVGLSGSISMMNADLDDDIDLFIITKKNRLFTGRFLATMIAFIMGLKRPLGLKKASDKVCLNLFFDESNLKVPKFKQTLFVGHEVLQMKPIINKDYVYERFLVANGWIFKLFPNAIENLESRIQNSELKNKISNSKLIHNSKFIILNFGRILELFFKKIQLLLINRHKTTEIITSSQLWFHPDDFEKKIKFL